MDGVVLLCGCDKTTPSLVMGACSVNIPTIVVSGGPMLTGRYEGKSISTSDVWRFNDAVRSGEMSQEQLTVAEACMCRSAGHCAVMGTASTMACMVESLGLTLPSNAAIPAADSRRKVLAQYSGARIVDMVKENLRPSDILTREAFENAIRLNAAIGGSTNFVIHLLAIANRIGVPLTLEDFHVNSAGIPLLANLQPSGKYFMEDFYYAGGLPVVIKALGEKLHNKIITANGKTVEENCADAKSYTEDVIADLSAPFKIETGLAVVFGNHARVDDPNLNIDESSIMVLKNVGPVGYPGMPEVGNMAIPKKLLEKGITDMVRISDGRMSGTGFGTVILHVSPEAAIGGTLAIVQNGDMIALDVEKRTLQLMVSEDEIEKRKTRWKASHPQANRGYVKLYQEHVEQAHLGADMDFLRGCSGSNVTRDSH
jgi:dihydroxy-acid dehydratase